MNPPCARMTTNRGLPLKHEVVVNASPPKPMGPDMR